MLKEIPVTRQRSNEPRRRWFTNADFDVYVWQDDDKRIVAFQLCYDKSDDERVLFWTEKNGYAHAGIDGGGARESHGETPIFRADGVFDPSATLSRLMVVRGNMDGTVFEFIQQKVQEYGQPIDLPQGNWTEFSKR